MSKAEQLLSNILKKREADREGFKKEIQALINEEEISYADAIKLMEESRLFEVSPYILGYADGNRPIDILFNEYDKDIEDKYQTIWFTDITDWIDWSEGEIQEALDAAGIEDPYKLLYDYVMETNYIGYKFDW